jgi:hypothetical protein
MKHAMQLFRVYTTCGIEAFETIQFCVSSSQVTSDVIQTIEKVQRREAKDRVGHCRFGSQ